MNILQELQVEPNDIERRINHTIHLQQTRKEVYVKSQVIQEKIKKFFDKNTKADDFNIGDKVLKWYSRREDKGKHGEFDFLWQGPYVIYGYRGNNAFFLTNINRLDLLGGPVNGRMLKHYFSTDSQYFILLCIIVHNIAECRLDWMVIL